MRLSQSLTGQIVWVVELKKRDRLGQDLQVGGTGQILERGERGQDDRQQMEEVVGPLTENFTQLRRC